MLFKNQISIQTPLKNQSGFQMFLEIMWLILPFEIQTQVSVIQITA